MGFAHIELVPLLFLLFLLVLKVEGFKFPTLTFQAFLARSNRDPQLVDRLPTKTNRKFLNWAFNCQGGNGQECWDQMVRARPQKQPEREGKGAFFANQEVGGKT